MRSATVLPKHRRGEADDLSMIKMNANMWSNHFQGIHCYRDGEIRSRLLSKNTQIE